MNKMIMLMAGFALAGCATAIRGTTNQVTFASEPSGAIVTTSLGHSCVTPCVIQIERNKPFEATFNKDGFERTVVAVRTEVSREGGTSFAGNILLGGLVGMGVDAVSGAALDHSPNPVIGRLAAIAPPAPVIQPRSPLRQRQAPRRPIATLTERAPLMASVVVPSIRR